MVVGNFAESVETVVIGAGPGGYVAAIRAAQLGQDVVLIEKELMGGVCLNWGCIPSKALIELAGLHYDLPNFAEMGLNVTDFSLDITKTHAWKDGIVKKLRSGIETLVEKHGIERVLGTAKFVSDSEIEVETERGISKFEFENAIIATGSSPKVLPNIEIDHERVLDSRDALALPQVPKKLVVIGAGSVGLELGIAWRKLGAEVTVLEALPDLLPFLDDDITRVLQKSIKALDIELTTGAHVKSVEPQKAGVSVIWEKEGSEQTTNADVVLVAIGRKPNTNSLGLDNAGIEIDDRGFIPVDAQLRTSKDHIFAIGDVIFGPMLAHRASHMGKVAAEVIAEKPAAFDNTAVPNIIFTDPEIASVGFTEKDARDAGYEIEVGAFPFRALGRASTLGKTAGLTKIISDADSGIVLGVHIIGPHASDLIAEGTLAVETAAHRDDVALTIHAHPTLAEGMMEASEDLENKAIHIYSPPS